MIDLLKNTVGPDSLCVERDCVKKVLVLLCASGYTPYQRFLLDYQHYHNSQEFTAATIFSEDPQEKLLVYCCPPPHKKPTHHLLTSLFKGLIQTFLSQ